MPELGQTLDARIDAVEVYLFERPRDEAYLGDVPGSVAIGDRYVVRRFNGTVYPLADRSLVVRVRGADGAEGWGETYGLVAPKAVAEIIADLLAPYLTQLEPMAPDAAWHALYALQRCRGYWGGYLADALAALDIALWDLHARRRGESLQASLGRPGSGEVGAYVSGLPGRTKGARLEMAEAWRERGFNRLKIPISATDAGDVPGEFESLRTGLGPDHSIALDMHWAYAPGEAIALARDLEPYDPWFFEAPVAPEDVAAQAEVARGIAPPLALGEEWRTLWDYRPRAEAGACSIVQPEMGHTGVTQFMAIGRAAREAGAAVIPHATIGLGIFMQASLRAALALRAQCHEFQHTIYGRNAELLEGAATCVAGRFAVPDTSGHGVRPTREAGRFLTRIGP